MPHAAPPALLPHASSTALGAAAPASKLAVPARSGAAERGRSVRSNDNRPGTILTRRWLHAVWERGGGSEPESSGPARGGGGMREVPPHPEARTAATLSGAPSQQPVRILLPHRERMRARAATAAAGARGSLPRPAAQAPLHLTHTSCPLKRHSPIVTLKAPAQLRSVLEPRIMRAVLSPAAGVPRRRHRRRELSQTGPWACHT